MQTNQPLGLHSDKDNQPLTSPILFCPPSFYLVSLFLNGYFFTAMKTIVAHLTVC